MDDRWLSMKEICAYLGVSHDTISRWIAKDMPALKMGRSWRFKRELVEKWLQEGEQIGGWDTVVSKEEAEMLLDRNFKGKKK